MEYPSSFASATTPRRSPARSGAPRGGYRGDRLGTRQSPSTRLLLVNLMNSNHACQARLGSTLSPDDAAITVDTEGNFALLLPDLPPDQKVPRGMLLLVAVLTRSSDPEWVEEMLEWLTEQARN